MTNRRSSRPLVRIATALGVIAAIGCGSATMSAAEIASPESSPAPSLVVPNPTPDYLPFPAGSDKAVEFQAFVPSHEVSLSNVLAAPPQQPAPKSAALRPLSEVNIQTRLPDGGALPNDAASQVHASAASGAPPVVSPWADQRPWMSYEFAWVASNMVHRPLYFEDLNLERYGNSACPALQPAISGARFMAELSLLPYQVAIHRPRECIYLLGYCRPGSRAPNLAYVPPLRLDAAAVEAAAITGAVFIIP